MDRKLPGARGERRFEIRKRSTVPKKTMVPRKGNRPEHADSTRRQHAIGSAHGQPRLKPLYAELKDGQRIRLCGPVAVTAAVAKIDGHDLGLEIHFRTLTGALDKTVLPRKYLSSPKATADFLHDQGIDVTNTPSLQRLMCDLLAQLQPRRILLLAPREGLHRVLRKKSKIIVWTTARKTFGLTSTTDLDVRLDPSAPKITSAKGTLPDWQSQVVGKAKGNPMLVFALALPFAAALLRTCRLHGFIVVFVADSTSEVAPSV